MPGSPGTGGTTPVALKGRPTEWPVFHTLLANLVLSWYHEVPFQSLFKFGVSQLPIKTEE